MPVLLTLTYLQALITTTRANVRRQVNSDVGATTLELVIIILGLILIAGLLVAAITAAVQRRINQIN
ncbi:MAG: hypothetical protein BGO38_08835 [Cellulomonas sp. 73-145]|uniref:hypothetical protein n=1 Tax=Cellulomonas sp. 73-145 TaxID=1895739 RepID=UPI000927A48C|nr:hypothetical protein [Cellulomonas sp. 73-145]MBN9327005.1 hypothetical protein [Cellulomonas sp.]OJV58273.1 MAG: hypothetical protein BGO38_08835 [Cellulomonas sp. 73-145]